MPLRMAETPPVILERGAAGRWEFHAESLPPTRLTRLGRGDSKAKAPLARRPGGAL